MELFYLIWSTLLKCHVASQRQLLSHWSSKLRRFLVKLGDPRQGDARQQVMRVYSLDLPVVGIPRPTANHQPPLDKAGNNYPITSIFKFVYDPTIQLDIFYKQ